MKIMNKYDTNDRNSLAAKNNSGFRSHRPFSMLLSVLLAFGAGAANAEDIEIYSGVILSSSGVNVNTQTNPDFFPNVLFILDNSTSMGETEPILDRIVSLSSDDDDDDDDDASCDIDVSDYDPNIDYDFDLTNGTDDNIYIYRGNNFTGNVVTPGQNQCDTYRNSVAAGGANPPILTSQLIQWGFIQDESVEVCRGGGRGRTCFFEDRATYGWDGDLSNYNNSTDLAVVECAADNGIHGHDDRRTTRDPHARNTPNNDERFIDQSTRHFYSGANFGVSPYTGVESVDWVSANYHRFLQLRNGATQIPETCPPSVTTAATSPFDATAALGTKTNPETADDVGDICGGTNSNGTTIPDRRPSSGRSQLPDNANEDDDDVEFFKNRYYKIEDEDNADLVNVYRCQTRLDVMKEALTNTLQTQSQINAGLMRFNRNASSPNGGTVINAILPMTDSTAKESLIDNVNLLEFGQATPLAESLYEAYQYLSGGTIVSGRQSLGNGGGTHATFDVDFRNLVTNNRTSFQTDPAARTSSSGSRYASPMNTQCQPTNIVLLSDGEPSNDDDLDTEIEELIGTQCTGSNSSNCAEEMAQFLRDSDVAPSSTVNRGVNTYTIGLNLRSDTLPNIARSGQPTSASGGLNSATPGYFEATDVSGLESAFRSILGQIQTSEADLFSAPAVTVNAFNRLQSREDIYYALFKPETGPRWGGNVKRYRVNAEAQIVDSIGNVAIDESTGFFSEDSQSEWSPRVDGSQIDAGGAGSRLVFARRMFGNVNGVDVSLSEPIATGDLDFLDAELNNIAVARFLEQTVDLDTNPIDIGALSSGTKTLAENQAEIAAFTLGLDIETGLSFVNSNNYIGDSLHGTPYVLSFGESINNPEDVIFFTSNQGLLQAIDGETGDELWSYVPDNSLFENLGEYFNNIGTDKVYGLDSEIAFKVLRDPTTDKEIDGASLFFGQRRGGDKIFSVDVTNARELDTQPVSRRWVIDGGVGDFERMGQTWAEPVVADVNYCDDNNGCGDSGGTRRSVLFISGGYDEYYDDPTNNINSLPNPVINGTVRGNALYMVDSATGELLWMAGASVVDADRDLQLPEMVHSIVAKPTVIDSDSNGFADTIYVNDIAGQVFRIDFRTSSIDTDDISSDENAGAKVVAFGENDVAIDNVSGGQVASFITGDNRRFYNPIDVTLLPEERDDTGAQVAPARYALTTGSGYRAHPLDQESFGNRIFVVYDENVLLPLSDETLNAGLDGDDIPEPVYKYAGTAANPRLIFINNLSLLSIVGGATDSDPARLSGVPPSAGFGYSITLPGAGEKLLNPALISNFRLLTTSYTPSVNNSSNLTDTCEAGLGTSTIYSLDLRTGNLISDVLDNPGISPTPVIVFVLQEGDFITPPGGGPDIQEDDVLRPIVVIGTEPRKGDELGLSDVNVGRADKKVWWEQDRAR